jgi:hypothetical protein
VPFFASSSSKFQHHEEIHNCLEFTTLSDTMRASLMLSASSDFNPCLRIGDKVLEPDSIDKDPAAVGEIIALSGDGELGIAMMRLASLSQNKKPIFDVANSTQTINVFRPDWWPASGVE